VVRSAWLDHADHRPPDETRLVFRRHDRDSVADRHAWLDGTPRDQEAATAYYERVKIIWRGRFPTRASRLASPSPAAALASASRLAPRDVTVGTVILRQGDPGDECYLVHVGEVAVVTSAGAENECERARLGPGELFGEMALLSGAPRSATVIATKDCQLLVLSRAELRQLMAADWRVASWLVDLLRSREGPRRMPEIAAFPQKTAHGEQIVVLKDPARRRYFRLSEDGWRLWQSLDGETSRRELIIRQFRATRKFAPQAVIDLLDRLAEAGFVEIAQLTEIEKLTRPSRWRVIAAWLTHAFTWQTYLIGCDRWLSRLYAKGVWVLFTRPALALCAAIAVSGLVALIVALIGGQVALTTERAGGSLLWFFYAAILVSGVLHEAGHAFAAKFFGREVDRIGIGWFWFGPIAFVDTSDMWLTGRQPRIAVDLAGIGANAVCAGFAVLAALLIGSGPWAAVLWQFVLSSWSIVLANLNPLFEYDGYYALSDWLDRPYLRRQALARLWQHGQWRTHRLELGYAFAALAYIAVMGALIIGAYSTLFESWVARLLGAPVAAAAGWVIAFAFLLIAALQTAPAARGRIT
jgi:putative peptide zinc metalloprotease protein